MVVEVLAPAMRINISCTENQKSSTQNTDYTGSGMRYPTSTLRVDLLYISSSEVDLLFGMLGFYRRTDD